MFLYITVSTENINFYCFFRCSVSDLQDATKKYFFFFRFFAYSFLKVHLHHSSKIKSHKEVTKQKKSRCFFIILFVDGRIRIRIRTNKLRLRIRIQEAKSHTVPRNSVPDPEYSFFYWLGYSNFSFLEKARRFWYFDPGSACVLWGGGGFMNGRFRPRGEKGWLMWREGTQGLAYICEQLQTRASVTVRQGWRHGPSITTQISPRVGPSPPASQAGLRAGSSL